MWRSFILALLETPIAYCYCVVLYCKKRQRIELLYYTQQDILRKSTSFIVKIVYWQLNECSAYLSELLLYIKHLSFYSFDNINSLD